MPKAPTPTRWTKSKDGKARTTIRVDFRLTLSEVVEILAFLEGREGLDPADLTAAQVRDTVRSYFADYGNSEAGDGADAEPSGRHWSAARRGFGDPDAHPDQQQERAQ